jgi:maleylacetate reductase
MMSRVETGHARVIFGLGSRAQLPEEIRALGCRRVFAILGAELESPYGIPIVGRATAGRGLVLGDIARDLSDQVDACGADALLAIGGGTTVGLAKAISLPSRLPVIAVPTTYAGSEMTPMWAFTEDGQKVSGINWMVAPRLVIYDPELQTLLLSPEASAVSAMSAVAHAAEALWAAGANPLSSALAEDAIRALGTGLGRLLAVPEDPVVRTTLLRGAWLAGMALAGAGTAIHHRLCHALGDLLGVAEVELHPVMLTHVAAYMAPTEPGAMARIARALRCDDPVAGIGRLVDELELPRSLAELGLRTEQLGEAVERVVRAEFGSPSPLSEEDAWRLLVRAFEGPVWERALTP